ncbi:unnamed protein product, partial [Discosporangium mesarthrocarpum]
PVSQVIAYFLQRILPSKPTILKDSRSLIHRLESTTFNTQQLTLVAADVTALYPSLDIKTVIWRTMSAERMASPHVPPFLVKFLQYVLQNNYVRFDADIFQQIFGLTMGTPAAPDLANITLAEIEASIVSNMEPLLLFVRYIDDFCSICR